MKPIISVENLSKRYFLGRNAATEGLRHRLERMFTAPFKGGKAELTDGGRKVEETKRPKDTKPAADEFWALKDVSFEVQQGEVVGIIGRNGAGKSTLLKVLSRITEPTKGRVTIDGRVASLLEVGTGFHPELTGRENIFLNGAILGMTKREIKAKFDEIVDFAEVERFIDTPVKRYSSGMYVRLAFAVAAHLEPEILIVDEVLAVGDTEFQKKCLGKMKDVSTSGRTVLFVSHQMGAVLNLCAKAVLLERGSVKFVGDSAAAVELYTKPLEDTSAARRFERCRFLRRCGFANAGSDALHASVPVGGSARINLEFHMPIPSRKPVAGVICRRVGTGEMVFGANSRSCGQPELAAPVVEAGMQIDLSPLNLVPGHYSLDVWVGHDQEDLEGTEALLDLEIIDNDPLGTGRPVLAQFGSSFVPMKYQAVAAS